MAIRQVAIQPLQECRRQKRETEPASRIGEELIPDTPLASRTDGNLVLNHPFMETEVDMDGNGVVGPMYNAFCSAR